MEPQVNVCFYDPYRFEASAAVIATGHGDEGWQHSGHSHFPGQARLDFHPESIPKDLSTASSREPVIDENQEQLEALVATGVPVTSSIDETGIRTVAISGVNAEPCGGTHVRDLAALRGARILEAKINGERSRFATWQLTAEPGPDDATAVHGSYGVRVRH